MPGWPGKIAMPCLKVLAPSWRMTRAAMLWRSSFAVTISSTCAHAEAGVSMRTARQKRFILSRMAAIVDLRSDTVTRPSAGMRRAMLEAELGDDVFGDDPTVNRLRRRAAGICGFEAALFFPSGTQSNLAALMSHCQRGEEVILGQEAHSYRYEAGGVAVLGSIQPQAIANRPDGTLDLAEIEAAIKPDDPHFARTRLLALENTIGGRVLSRPYLEQAIGLAKRRG